MLDFAAKIPTIPIPFHRLLKVVALVDGSNPHAGALIERLRGEGFEVEVSDRYDRDVAEDSEVGAYIASVDGDNRASARALAKAIRDCGFKTPLWALADTSHIADVSVLGMIGEVDGFIYLGEQTPAFYAKQVIASLTSYGMSLLPPFFGGLMAYDAEARISFACPGHQGGEFYRKCQNPQTAGINICSDAMEKPEERHFTWKITGGTSGQPVAPGAAVSLYNTERKDSVAFAKRPSSVADTCWADKMTLGQCTTARDE
jgi:hypothetical protein